MTAATNSSPLRRTRISDRVTSRLWQIFLLWMVLTVPLLSLISLSIEPRFEAFSTLQVEPISPRLFSPVESGRIDYQHLTPYLQTQVGLLTSDRVLQEALTDPRVNNLSSIKKSDDPKADLRKNLVVEIVPDAYLIRVALKLPDANQAAAIVNAVVHSYLSYNSEYQRGRNSTLRASLITEQGRIQKEIDAKRSELRKLANESTVNATGPALDLNVSGKASDPTQPVFSGVTDELSQQVASEMVKTDLDLIKAQAILEAKQAEGQGENDPQSRQTLGELRLNVATLLKQKDYLVKYFSHLKVDNKLVMNDSFEATFVNRQLEILLRSADQLNTNIQELNFKASQEDFRVSQVDAAVAPKVAAFNNQLKYMASAPLAVLLLVIGFFLLMPIELEPASLPSASADRRGTASGLIAVRVFNFECRTESFGLRHLVLTLAALFILPCPAPAKQPSRLSPKPNIVIILADDLGYGDLGCYGHPRFKTPNLDRMAKEGVLLTQFNTPMPFCAPTRAALLTGRYPFRSGLSTNPDPDGGAAADAVALPPGEVTLAQILRKAGYATGMVGKWHLGHKSPNNLPTQRGFEEYLGIPYSNDMRPVRLLEGKVEVEYPVVQATLTKRYTERALRFIERNRDRPFFLYFAQAMPHKPLAVSEAFYKKSGAGLYGDTLAELDWSVGQVLTRLKDLGLDAQTLVIFTSDNGAWYGGSTGGLRGMKSTTWEGGFRVPCIVRWPGRLPAGRTARRLA